MPENPARKLYREFERDRNLMPEDWLAVDCPRCGRGTYLPQQLLGKALCVSCLPRKVRLEAHVANEASPAETTPTEKGG